MIVASEILAFGLLYAAYHTSLYFFSYQKKVPGWEGGVEIKVHSASQQILSFGLAEHRHCVKVPKGLKIKQSTIQNEDFVEIRAGGSGFSDFLQIQITEIWR